MLHQTKEDSNQLCLTSQDPIDLILWYITLYTWHIDET
jgi:hypothetical protein